MKPQDSSMLYKLIVLYMLKIAGYPLTNSDISDYVLIKGYTDSLTLQIAITDLENDQFIKGDKMHNRTYFELTAEGKNTIDSLEDKLAANLKNDIYTYFSINDKAIKSNHTVKKKVYENENGEFVAEMTVLDKKSETMNLKLAFPTKALAAAACDKFENVSTDIYKYIIEKLMS